MRALPTAPCPPWPGCYWLRRTIGGFTGDVIVGRFIAHVAVLRVEVHARPGYAIRRGSPYSLRCRPGRPVVRLADRSARHSAHGRRVGCRRPARRSRLPATGEGAVCALLLPVIAVMLLAIWRGLCGIVQDMAHPEIRAARDEQPPPPPPLPGTPWPARLWYRLTVPPPQYHGDPAALDSDQSVVRVLTATGTLSDSTACRVCGCTRRAPCRPGCAWQPTPSLCAGCDILVPLVRVTGDGPYADVLLITLDTAETARLPVGGEFDDSAARDQALSDAARRFAASHGWELAGAWRAAVGNTKIGRVTGRASAVGRAVMTLSASPAEITGDVM